MLVFCAVIVSAGSFASTSWPRNAVSAPYTIDALSPDDRSAFYRKQAELTVSTAFESLPFMSQSDIAELDAMLAAERRNPLTFAELLGLGAALGAVGSLLTGYWPGITYRTRANLAVGAAIGGAVGTLITGAGYATVTGGLPAIGRLAQVRPLPPVGFAPGDGMTALQNNARMQHAVDRLAKGGIPLRWSNESAAEIRAIFARILERPTTAFDNTLRTPVEVRGFAGTINGTDVVLYVYKEGNRIGQIATSVVPNARQKQLYRIP
jgi:hypothetical protein